jgi:glycyl-tRNA synthetase beta subunit
VLVNAPEPELKANRQALLGAIQREFRTFADISEIVVEK